MGGSHSTELSTEELKVLSGEEKIYRPLTKPHEKCAVDFVPSHWILNAVEAVDEKGYDMLILKPGTILYKGFKSNVSSALIKRGFYGTFDTAVQYAFRTRDFKNLEASAFEGF